MFASGKHSLEINRLCNQKQLYYKVLCNRTNYPRCTGTERLLRICSGLRLFVLMCCKVHKAGGRSFMPGYCLTRKSSIRSK